MTDEEKISLIRILIGDTETSPFYMLLTDEEIQKLLDFSKGDVYKAARFAAASAYAQLSAWSTRERTGSIEVWNSVSTSYFKVLENLMKGAGMFMPDGLYPWYGSRDSCSKLLNIQVCDHEDSCGCSGCRASGGQF